MITSLVLMIYQIFTLGTGACQLVGEKPRSSDRDLDSHLQAAFNGNLGRHVHLGPDNVPIEIEQIIVFLKVSLLALASWNGKDYTYLICYRMNMLSRF